MKIIQFFYFFRVCIDILFSGKTLKKKILGFSQIMVYKKKNITQQRFFVDIQS